MFKKIKKILLPVTVAIVGTLGATAQTPHQSAHQNAHRQHKTQIAKATTPADRARINNHINKDVMSREEGNSGLSSKSVALIDDLLKEAGTHLGKKYVHGSKGPNTFDCSGYTSYVYRQFGYKILPASRAQYTEGVPVAREDLRKGDLVFFTSRSSGKNVGHVGIVVSNDKATGKVTFIHASIKGVRYSEIEGYYAQRYVGARRIITD